MALKNIEALYIDLNMFSGSTEYLRNLIGGYYETTESLSFIEGETTIEYVGVDEEKTTVGEHGDAEIEIDDAPISKVITSYTRTESTSADTLLTTYQVPIRVFGNPDYILNDRQWADKFTMPDWKDKTSETITTAHYDDFTFQRSYPYTLQWIR